MTPSQRYARADRAMTPAMCIAWVVTVAAVVCFGEASGLGQIAWAVMLLGAWGVVWWFKCDRTDALADIYRERENP